MERPQRPAWSGRSARRSPGRTVGIACRPGGARRRTLGAAPCQDCRAAGGAARRRLARRLGLAQRRLARRRGGLRASAGACWAAVGENLPLLLFGAMQPAHRGPALVACAALLLAVAVALGAGRLSGRVRAGVAIAALALAAGALSGWPWGGEAIGPLRWGGLLVTLILAIAALLAAVPLAAGLALLRRSSSPAGSFAAATLIEAVRGVPLVTQLLFASFVLPMLLGGGVSKFSMALAALTLHTACLLAEVLRGALQAIPPGQMAAARALGMGSALAYQAVIWPQARRIAAPAALGVFVGAVKDTSLVSIIGVFDVLGAAKAVVAGTAWRPYHVEVYMAVAALYFAASLALSRVARAMETGRL
ncbi:amino acid ABC transporter permease [Achromobacter xylosoxidans]